MLVSNLQHLADDVLARARDGQIAHPVLMMLGAESKQANAIVLDIQNNAVPALTVLQVEDVWFVVVARKDATELLRQHAGAGGSSAANAIDVGVEPDFWSVALQEESIRVAAIASGVEIGCFSTSYVDARPSPWQAFGKPGPIVIDRELPTGERFTVSGDTGKLAEIAAVIVESVLTRRVQIPSQGTCYSVGLTDEQVAECLYSFNSEPLAFVEAIRALAKMPGDNDRWLMRLLRNRPGLQNLAEQVRKELDAS